MHISLCLRGLHLATGKVPITTYHRLLKKGPAPTLWKVNKPMINPVQMAYFLLSGMFKICSMVVTIRIILSFLYRPYMKNAEFLCAFRQVRIPGSSCIFKMGMDGCHIQSLQSLHMTISEYLAMPICCWTLKPDENICADQNRLDVSRIPRYSQQCTPSRGWLLISS